MTEIATIDWFGRWGTLKTLLYFILVYLCVWYLNCYYLSIYENITVICEKIVFFYEICTQKCPFSSCSSCKQVQSCVMLLFYWSKVALHIQRDFHAFFAIWVHVQTKRLYTLYVKNMWFLIKSNLKGSFYNVITPVNECKHEPRFVLYIIIYSGTCH